MPSTSATPLPEMSRVLLAGGTGLVGRECLRLLLKDPMVSELRVLLRRGMSPAELVPDAAMAPHLGKLKVLVSPFDRLREHPDWFEVDTVFCALGTTIKQVKTQAAFREVDFQHPLTIAELARAQGARHYLLVSALGASARSRVFYSRVKGELEEALKALNFEALTIAQPSLLLGDRAELRPGEVIGQHLAFLVPAKYKPVHVRQVALGLWQSARHGQRGLHILNNTALLRQPVKPHATASS